MGKISVPLVQVADLLVVGGDAWRIIVNEQAVAVHSHIREEEMKTPKQCYCQGRDGPPAR